MILRFSLYGFLKNLRLFEVFLLLALRERGLDFFAIGGLVAVREVTVNLLEVPSGALADAAGRRRCMVASMAAYVLSYLVLGLAGSWWLLALAMAAFGFGDAFRSGTHKALIMAWLRQEGREAERTRVYGYTRSWSKIGSALSALGGGALLVAGLDYRWVFLGSALPAALNLVNLATYPAALDGDSLAFRGAWRSTWRNLVAGLKSVVAPGPVRGLVLGSAALQGGYAVAKDYVQPVLQSLAVATPLALGLDGQQRTGLLVGIVGAVLYLVASFASRRAHAAEERLGGPDAGVLRVSLAMLLVYALLSGGAWLGWSAAIVVAFVALAVGQNLWRPMQIARFDRDAGPQHSATVLSIEAQAKAAAAAVLAPLIGALVDRFAAGAEPAPVHALWPVGLLGLPLALHVLVERRGRRAAGAGAAAGGGSA